MPPKSLALADTSDLTASTDLPAESRKVIVPPLSQGERLDVFLTEGTDSGAISRAEWRRRIDAGQVRVNGVRVKSGTRLHPGDMVGVEPAISPSPLPPGDAVPFTVVYEDPAMLVIDKPAGIVVHPSPGHERGTLVNGLVERYPELLAQTDPEGQPRPGIVHRLDKDTSGLMVVGRTAAATAALQLQMRARETEKRYLALVIGSIAEDEGLIDIPISRDPRHRQRMAGRSGGRESRTEFQVLERFGDYTYVGARLLTGRTHQLRVHFAYIGHPVAGDSTYGPGRSPGQLARQFLHAHFLKLISPFDGKERTFTSELPADLRAALELLRRRGVRG